MSTSYRPDIDGLRAVAVLAVLVGHAGFSFFSGGFVGVDIFFVISGYLITKILYSEMKEHSFTFKSFYMRRVRRILPAFYVVAITTLVAGYFLMLPKDFEQLARSFIASAFFYSNMFFARASEDYFSYVAHEMPLLHMWSLSVEEQFYLAWPLFLTLLANRSSAKILLVIIAAIIIVSFGVAQIWLASAPIAAYYNIVARAGELLMGGFLAVLPNNKNMIGPRAANIASVIGLLLVCGSIVLMDEHTVFPGINAFWPCFGAVLIIMAGNNREALSYKLLSCRAMVFVGLISYSLYLWHWPLLAYTRYLQYEITAGVGICLIVISILLAYLSWRYVEQPFRRKRGANDPGRNKRIFAGFSFASLILAFVFAQGAVSSLSGNARNFQDVQGNVDYASRLTGWCSVDSDDGFDLPFSEKYLNCATGTGSAATRGLLWGDSHAGSYAPFVDYIGKELGVSLVEMSTAACPPGLSPNQVVGFFQPTICRGFRQEAKKNIADKKYDIIFMAARWESYTKWFNHNIYDAIVFASQNSKMVIVFAQVPRFEFDVGRCYVKEAVLPLSNECGEDRRYPLLDSVEAANKNVLARIASLPNVQFIDISQFLCDGGTCSPFLDGQPVYYDDDHLSIKGSQLLVHKYLATAEGKTLVENIRKLVASNQLTAENTPVPERTR